MELRAVLYYARCTRCIRAMRVGLVGLGLIEEIGTDGSLNITNRELIDLWQVVIELFFICEIFNILAPLGTSDAVTATPSVHPTGNAALCLCYSTSELHTLHIAQGR